MIKWIINRIGSGFNRIFPPKILTVKELAVYCKTPSDLGWWIQTHIEYETDEKNWGQKEYWETSEEVLDPKRRKADCEGWAILAHDVIKQWNTISCKPFILCVYSDKGGHAICGIENFDGHLYYNFIDTSGFKNVRAYSLDVLANSTFMGTPYLWEVTDTKRNVLKTSFDEQKGQ